MIDEIDVATGSSAGGALTDAAPSTSGATNTTTPTNGDSPAGVTPQSSDTQESDPLAGIPAIDDPQFAAAVARKDPYAEGLYRVRSEYDKIAPGYKEFESKYKPFEPVIDRFESPDAATELLSLRDDLLRQDRTDRGLEPNPSKFVERISTEYPVTADYLTRDLIWGNTIDQQTGQAVPRINKILEVLALDPETKAMALQILGGVEPSQIPQPSWTASQDELDKLSSLNLNERETSRLQELYRKLPYEKREEIRLNSPEFIRDYLEDQEFKAQTRLGEEQRKIQQAQTMQREQQEFRAATEQAGAQYIDHSIKEMFHGFTEGIVNDWQPTDDPIVNKVAASVVGVVTVALAHGETRFAGEALLGALQEMGIKVDPSGFDKDLNSYVELARNYGEMSFQAERQRRFPQNGNGDKSASYYKTESDRKGQRMLAMARTTIAANLMTALDKFFLAKAKGHNDLLESAAPSRPVPTGGTAPNPSGNRYAGRSREELAQSWSR